ncbi:MAG: hypothetical protein P8Y44_10880 [Acidobacteriota bacterium]
MSDPKHSINRQIPRRTFIIGVVASAVGFSLLGWWRLRSRGLARFDPVGEMLSRRLGFLDLEPDGVQSFSQDVEKVTAQIQISPTGELLEPRVPVIEGIAFRIENGAVRLYEDTMVRKFLLSSDFFIEGADESKTVHYPAGLTSKPGSGF